MDAGPAVRVDTSDVAPEESIEYWEQWNHRSLVGLRASALTAGFSARSLQATVDSAAVTRIQGRPHLIERSPRTISASPKHSVFLNVLLSGDCYLHRESGTEVLHPGDVLVYSTMQPYVQVFDSDMDLLIVDVEAGFAARTWGLDESLAPHVAHRPFDISGFLARAESLTRTPDGDGILALAEEGVLAVLRPDSQAPALHRRALELIEDHLGEADFGVDRLAAALHVSDRQLRRIFSAAGDSPGAVILTRRLARARRLLASGMTVTEAAHRCGFSSPSSFSRACRQELGVSPRQLRG